MVQEPTVGSDRSLGWGRSLGGDIGGGLEPDMRH